MTRSASLATRVVTLEIAVSEGSSIHSADEGKRPVRIRFRQIRLPVTGSITTMIRSAPALCALKIARSTRGRAPTFASSEFDRAVSGVDWFASIIATLENDAAGL